MAKNVGNIAPEEESKLCSKCAERPRRKDGPWCNVCKTEQIREYRQGIEGRAEQRGFGRGAIAFRDSLLEECRKANPMGMIRAGEMAEYIRSFPMPDYVDEDVMV